MQPAVAKLHPNFAPDQGLILADQLQGCLAISGPDPLNEISEATVLRHEVPVIGQSLSHFNQNVSSHRNQEKS